MTRMRTLLLLAFAMLTLGAVSASTAAAENALPHVLFLPGTTSGVLTANCTTVGSCESSFAGIRALKATTYKFEFNVAEDMTDKGTANIEFKGTTLEGKKCGTTEAASGLVVLPASTTWQFSFALSEANTLLTVVSIPEFTVKCEGGLNIKVRGKSVASLSPLNSETTSFSGVSNCSGTGNKTPEFSEFDTNAGMETGKLESSIGLGFEKSCQLEQGTVSLTGSVMAEIM